MTAGGAVVPVTVLGRDFLFLPPSGDEIIGVSFFPMATIGAFGRLEGFPVGVMLRVWKSTGEVYCQRIVLQR